MVCKRLVGLIGLLVIVSCRPAQGAEREARRLRVYFVGNSVTDMINYGGLERLAASRGYQHIWGRHMIPGAPLKWIWDHPDEGFQRPPFGYYSQALSKHRWDALCLQPFDRHLEGPDGDLALAERFIQAAVAKSPDLQVYVFARWPRKDKDGGLDFASRWLEECTGKWDGTNESKDYFEKLVLAMRKRYGELKKPALVVPVGHVMYELDRRMRAGQLPGLSSIGEVYRDRIHLNAVGSYIVACTFFATLYRDTPAGLPTEPYGTIQADWARSIQRAAWDVVSSHPLTGVTAASRPQPDAPGGTASASRPKGAMPSRAALAPKPKKLSRDERYRHLVVGTWEDDYQGKRTMLLKADGTGTMIVELTGLTATLFAARLQFDMVWSVKDGRLYKRTISGKPATRVNMILKMMGDSVNEPILELNEKRLLLLDKDGKTRYDWRRK